MPSFRQVLLISIIGLPAFPAGAQSFSDINGDGVQDAADVVELAIRQQEAGLSADEADALDLNQDGLLDGEDLSLQAGLFLETGLLPLDLDILDPPLAMAFTSDSQFTLRGQVFEPAAVFAQDTALENVNGEFEIPVFLNPGLNTVQVRARRLDEARPFATQARSIFLDLNPPSLTINSPPPQSNITDNVVAVQGTSQDETAVTIRVTTPAGEVETKPDAFGSFSVEVPLSDGLQDIQITAVDMAGLETSTSLTVRSHVSEEMTVASENGATVHLPEGAMGREDTTVRLFDVSNAEMDAIFGHDFLATAPQGGLEGLTEGVIVLPSAMMLEVENPPDETELFQRPISISIPNETGADNSMPIWIFQITPDITGDNEPQLSLVSRGKVSDDGSAIVPITDGTGPVDGILPGIQNNPNFGESQLEQVKAARAVRNLQARLRNERQPSYFGRNVAVARPLPARLAPAPAPPKALSPEPLPNSLRLAEEAVPPPASALRGPTFRLLVECYEDGDLLNELEPPGHSYSAKSLTVPENPNDPIRHIPLLESDLADKGDPDTEKPDGINGAVYMRGSFGQDETDGRVSVELVLLNRELPLNLSGVQDLTLLFDTQGALAGSDVKYEVTIEDIDGAHRYIEFEPGPEWETLSFPVTEFLVNTAGLRRIVWQISTLDQTGRTMDVRIDNMVFVGSGPPPTIPPPPPTVTVTPFEDPTPPPFPTGTPNPAVTPTPVEDPRHFLLLRCLSRDSLHGRDGLRRR